MKPTKNAVAIVIKNAEGQFLTVRRPKDEDGPLAGVWGFPAIMLQDGESERDAALRVGRVKLGINLEIGDKIGDRIGDRGGYTLHLSDYATTIPNGELPKVPQPDRSIVQYTDLRYEDNPKVLFLAAQKGSLCSQVYLASIGLDWNESIGKAA